MLARVHLVLGLLVALPLLAWTSSGLLYSLPNQVQGARYGHIDFAQVRVGPREAALLAGKPLSALTLQFRDGHTEWDAIAGLDELRIDAGTGAVEAVRVDGRTAFFREAHFWWFTGGAQRWLVPLFALLACASSLSGLLLAAFVIALRSHLRRPDTWRLTERSDDWLPP